MGHAYHTAGCAVEILSPALGDHSYPPPRVDDVRAATAYVAQLVRERIVEIGQRGVA